MTALTAQAREDITNELILANNEYQLALVTPAINEDAAKRKKRWLADCRSEIARLTRLLESA